MTDCSELVNDLRASELWTRHERDGFRPDGTPFEAADALEAQAKEIAEKDARIAELEATNSVLRDAVQKFVDYDSTYHKDKEKMMLDYEVAIAAARAALNGEN